jgi:4-diphosphocytidyl-2-C-methyl-D-erythritol kinase
MASVSLRAFAKINLHLRVKGARADGFHEVQTILQSIDLFDRVTCAARRGPFEIVCRQPGVPTDGSNLVWTAAQLLWRAAGRSGQARDARVVLEKQIPMQAGLGGGSSDAAAALLALRQVWRLRVPDHVLRELAAEIGSDVPFFLVGGTALAVGRGEEVYPLQDLPPLHVVLVLPPFGVSTRDAYAWLDAEAAEPCERPFFAYLPVRPRNDLEGPVARRHPVIKSLGDRLLADGALLAAMSGSGSTVFGVFDSERRARVAARRLAQSGAAVKRARFRPRRKG